MPNCGETLKVDIKSEQGNKNRENYDMSVSSDTAQLIPAHVSCGGLHKQRDPTQIDTSGLIHSKQTTLRLSKMATKQVNSQQNQR